MSRYVHLVFSDPPAGVSDDEFNVWYDEHVQEILAVPGFDLSAAMRSRRSSDRMDPAVSDSSPSIS